MRHCLLVFLTLFLLLPFAYGGCGGSSPDGNSSDDNGPSAVISGEVFEDTNINGIRDLNEDGMSGVNITASGAGSFLETVTDQVGAYRVRIEEPGTYLVTKTDPPGYLPTNAIPGSDGSKIDNNSMEVVVTDAYVDAEKELPG